MRKKRWERLKGDWEMERKEMVEGEKRDWGREIWRYVKRQIESMYMQRIEAELSMGSYKNFKKLSNSFRCYKKYSQNTIIIQIKKAYLVFYLRKTLIYC